MKLLVGLSTHTCLSAIEVPGIVDLVPFSFVILGQNVG